MVKTGGSIFIALPLVVMLLSLLPVCILFVRKVAVTALLNVLRILCVFVCLQYLTLYFIQPGSLTLHTGFKLAEFTLSFYLFKLLMRSSQGKEIMNIGLASFLSIVITIYSLKGITAYSEIITLIQASLLTLPALAVIYQLINNRHIVLLNEPGFWIASGLFCYNAMVVFMETIAGRNYDLSQAIQQDKDIIIMVADMLRMIFFIVAASVAGKKENNNSSDDQPPPPPPFPPQVIRRTIKY